MIILDTNVLSALASESPQPEVVEWLDRQPGESIWITSVTVFEARFEEFLALDINNRVLVLDTVSADRAAKLAGERQRAGRTVDFRDTLIAVIALTRKAVLATRNVRHFADLPVPVVNPWDD